MGALSQARSPISYLNALLRSSTDFHTLAGRRFVYAQHKRRFEVSSDGAVVSVHGPGQRVRNAGGAWREAFVRALRQGQVIAQPDSLPPVAAPMPSGVTF
ncbi:hypothetical protein [Robbsia andropogonis]|uniref:hypothetical protein n=1 Tax=Robbsia andropogonis TaxID=28092 RepID=UPI0012FD3CE7|nr:hypothetical protein [Robbsia andropogonis]